MPTRILSIIIVAITVFGTACSKQVSFKDDVNPILVSNCLLCHVGGGEGSVKSEFSVQDYDSLMRGTKFGPVIVPGDSESSTLYRLVAQKAEPEIQMPPHHDKSLAEGRLEPLTPEQVQTISMWINQGAKNN